MCFDLTHAPVATTARAAATGPVSMSTRPDPEGSDTVEPSTCFRLFGPILMMLSRRSSKIPPTLYLDQLMYWLCNNLIVRGGPKHRMFVQLDQA